MKKEVYTHRSLETEGMAHHSGPHGEGPGLIRRQKRRTEHCPEPLLGFQGKEWVNQGKYDE